VIVVIDNYDSFTYNLVQYLGELGEDLHVVRNDDLLVEEVEELQPEAIVLSPGPCTPAEAGICVPLIQELGSSIPILGVCLGHQAIGAAYGAKVIRAPRGVMHGKTSQVRHSEKGLFAGLPNPLRVMRYHSLVVERSSLPAELLVEAVADDDEDEVHALRHSEHPVWGVQFHPESILTDGGKALLQNFLTAARGVVRAGR
jgi:anthranilate synthase/aminodeoxychorismate synthase-like glutamine amidotransferase